MARRMDGNSNKPESDDYAPSEPKRRRIDSNVMEVSDSPMETSSVSQPPSVQSTTTPTGSTSATVTSMGTASTATAPTPTRFSNLLYPTHSGTPSSSGASCLGRRNVQDMPYTVPSYGIPAPYLERAPYVEPASVPEEVPVPMPLYQLPVIILPENHRNLMQQEQLQHTHYQLQQLMLRQQLQRQQLLSSFGGLLQPTVGDQDSYSDGEDWSPVPASRPDTPYDSTPEVSAANTPQRSPSRLSPNLCRAQNVKKNNEMPPPQ